MKFLAFFLVFCTFVGCSSQVRSSNHNDLRNVIKSNKPEFKTCFDEAAKADPNLEGTLLSKFIVNPKGQVISSSVILEKSTIKNENMIECMNKEILALKFPEISPATTNREITFPFLFKKNDKQTFSN